MSRWQIIGKSRTAMAILLVLGCMLLFQAVSAQEPCTETCTALDPDIKNVELYVGCNYEFCIDFYTQPGMSGGGVNAFYVFFDDKVKIDPALAKECIQISWDGKTSTPAKVEVYTKSNLPAFAPECANGAVKIWVSQDIPSNSDVTICFNCGLSCPQEEPCEYQDCIPCEPCQNFVVWVANDVTRCPVISTQFVKVTASSGTGGYVSYPPTGQSAAPDFNTYFKYGSTPTYLITGNSYIINTIDIDPLCEGVFDPAPIVYNNGTVNATYTFDPLTCPYKITATFTKKPVYGYLKYQLPQSECGAIVKVKVWGTGTIQPMLNFTDDLYRGGHSAKFDVTGMGFRNCALYL